MSGSGARPENGRALGKCGVEAEMSIWYVIRAPDGYAKMADPPGPVG